MSMTLLMPRPSSSKLPLCLAYSCMNSMKTFKVSVHLGILDAATRWSIRMDVQVHVCCREFSRVIIQASSGHTCGQPRFMNQAASGYASGQAATCFPGYARCHILTKCLDHAKYLAYYLLSMFSHVLTGCQQPRIQNFHWHRFPSTSPSGHCRWCANAS